MTYSIAHSRKVNRSCCTVVSTPRSAKPNRTDKIFHLLYFPWMLRKTFSSLWDSFLSFFLISLNLLPLLEIYYFLFPQTVHHQCLKGLCFRILIPNVDLASMKIFCVQLFSGNLHFRFLTWIGI